MVFPPKQFNGFPDLARYAARMIICAARIKDKMDRRELPVEKATSREKGQPLCMAQNYRLFTSYREPGLKTDRLVNTEANGPRTQQQIILACRNKFYALALRGSKDWDSRITEDEVAGCVLWVLENGEEETAPVGMLTSQRRDLWAEQWTLLREYDANKENMRLIEESLMVVCLDVKPLGSEFNRRGQSWGGRGTTAGQRDETNMGHQMIHGGGSQYNSPNRWFDKTIQVVITTDGVSGLCYEHSPSEGVAVIGLMEELIDACSDLAPSTKPLAAVNTPLKELQWVKPPNIQKMISEAASSLDNFIEDLDFYVYRFDAYGKNFIKSCKISPDAYLQLALQLAYYKLYGCLTATYESASTRRFLLGRVDCIRSASWEALQWVSAMTQGEAGDPLQPSKRVTFSLVTEDEKLALFDAAVQKQTEIMVDNILGQGIDVHLLGLREQSKLMNMPMDLFNDESYRICNHFALSTSQVATKIGFMGYGPVVPDGYGASYNILGDTIIFCLSAFYSSENTSTSRFAQSLEESLVAMQILLQTKPTQTK
ncbi:hypothetical protein AAG570_006509 [Ranatra chinensis]|uniref:Choline O-acetyltransferase n=1 Tax=Ranatra chinensis TaxID=642074 RepID=A0ABD0YU98_9HEMI